MGAVSFSVTRTVASETSDGKFTGARPGLPASAFGKCARVRFAPASTCHLTIRSSRPRVVASAMCFALRLHMSAAPPQGGLTQALGPANRLSRMDKNNFLIQLSESNRIDYGSVAFTAQTPQQQVFSAIWALESQVNNGGFDSFFEYEDPLLAAFAPEALHVVGAVNCADIVSRAISAGSDQLNDLDAEFYNYPDDLTDLLYKYISENPAAFGPIPGGA
jgi:hypothetical protein